MDFNEIDIPKVIKKSIDKRFQDFTPYDFEDFMAKLFQDLGYEVEQTNYTGDYGADLLIEKEGERLVVQIKRYKEGNKVGVQDINQVIGAKGYYKCDRAMVVTTSSYSKQGENLAIETGVTLHDWRDLMVWIRDLYWEGKDYYSFYSKDEPLKESDEYLKLSIFKVETFATIEPGGWGTIVYLSVENISEENIQLSYELPTHIDTINEQHEAIYWLTGTFNNGTIYAGCKVTIGYIFDEEHVSVLLNGDKIISKFSLGIGDEPSFNKEYISIYDEKEDEAHEDIENLLRPTNDNKSFIEANKNQVVWYSIIGVSIIAFMLYQIFK